MFYYSLFNLLIESDLEFPQLIKASEGEADIVIVSGEVPDEIFQQGDKNVYDIGDKISWLINPTCFLYVEEGYRITYQRKEGAPVKKLRNYIMGWGMSLVGLQRGIIAMHCSVVASDKGAILISGESGSGKSTLTNVLLDNGCKFMADDMAYVETKADGEVFVKPAFPYQKLCRDAAVRKGYPLDELIYVNEAKDKFLVPYKGDFVNREMPVKALIMLCLSNKSEVNVTECQGMNKFMVCANNQFLRHLLEGDKYVGVPGRECFKMAKGIKAFVIERPAEGDTLHAMSEVVMKIANELI